MIYIHLSLLRGLAITTYFYTTIKKTDYSFLSLFANPVFSSRWQHLPDKLIFQPFPHKSFAVLFLHFRGGDRGQGAKKIHFSAVGTAVEIALGKHCDERVR